MQIPVGETTHFALFSCEMSHQTGIVPNAELIAFMAKVRDSKCRLFKVSIEKEQLALSAKQDSKGDWKKDMELFVPALIEEKVPCYILFRLDNKEWLLLSYSPDNAPVRQKMLYASTKATMKKSFVIDSEFVASCKEDATLEGYEMHLKVEKAPPPMTMAERELAEIKLSENQCSVGVDHKQQTLKGLELPITDEAIDAMFCLKEGSVNYVQLGIDIANESVVLHEKKVLDSGDELKETLPPGEPRYHMYSFRHIHDNQRVSLCLQVF